MAAKDFLEMAKEAKANSAYGWAGTFLHYSKELQEMLECDNGEAGILVELNKLVDNEPG